MAKIPKLGGSTRINMQTSVAPTLSPQEASRGNRQAAAAASDVAGTLHNLRRQQIAEADKVDKVKGKIEFSRELDNLKKDLDSKYANTNYEGYSDEAKKRLRKKQKEILSQAPDRVKSDLELTFKQMEVGADEDFFSYEAKGKSAYALLSTEEGITNAKLEMANKAWDPEAAYERSLDLAGSIENSAHFSPERKLSMMKNAGRVQEDMVNGVISRGEVAEMRKAQRDLKSKEMSKLFNGIDPSRKKSLIGNLEAKIKTKENEMKRASYGQGRKLMSAISTGQVLVNNPAHQKMLEDTVADLRIKGGEEAEPMIKELETAWKATELMQEKPFDIFSLDTDEMAKGISPGDDLDSMVNRGNSSEVLSKVKRNMMAEFNKDPAAYITKHDKSLHKMTIDMMGGGASGLFDDYKSAMDSKFDQMRTPITNRKYITPQMKSHYGDTFNKFMDEGHTAPALSVLNDFDAEMGGNAHLMYEELGIPLDYGVVSEIPTVNGKLRALENIKNKDLDTMFKTRAKELDISTKDVRIELADNPLLEAYRDQDGGTIEGAAHSEALLNTVEREYKRLMVENSHLSSEQAKDQAWKIIGDRYTTLDQGGRGVLIPREHDTPVTQDFIDNFTGSADYVSTFDLKIPEGSTAEEMNAGISSSSKWVFNRKTNGLALMALDPREDKYKPIMDKNNKPIVKSFEEINSEVYPAKEEKIKKIRRKRDLKALVRRIDENFKKRSGYPE